MNVLRNEFFIRKDFTFYDSCISAALPLGALNVYDLLRRHVWVGSPPWGFEAEKGLHAQGLLFTVLTQNTQANMLGMKRHAVIPHLKVLNKLGWVRTVKRRQKRGYNRNAYVLGHTPDYCPPMWWADLWLDQLYRWMVRMAGVRNARFEAWRDSEDPAVEAEYREELCAEYEGVCPTHDISLVTVSVEKRIRMVRKFYAVALESGDVREAVKLKKKDLDLGGLL